MIKITLFVFIGIFSFSQSQDRFMPNLPMGEYRTVFEKIHLCESIKNQSLLANFYFDKKTSSETVLRGNLTFLIPFDDTLTIDLNLESWGSTGGWIPNSNVYVTKKACSTLKKLGGNAWYTAMKGFNIPSTTCPISVGEYITSGLDLKKFEDHGFPKIYFYGKYKLVFKIKTTENKIVACVYLEISLLRPWETKI
ncbi:uncharacterized protein LOC114131125 [Aphis gossypii]|uniref:uncharacterized protein LOC114131125 n=1 Tax=Aphis gossypii TaxID=80765 RepID=UPI002158C4C0|nr:uncharacterized protein LOC114131125 [Aphis gossypii]